MTWNPNQLFFSQGAQRCKKPANPTDQFGPLCSDFNMKLGLKSFTAMFDGLDLAFECQGVETPQLVSLCLWMETLHLADYSYVYGSYAMCVLGLYGMGRSSVTRGLCVMCGSSAMRGLGICVMCGISVTCGLCSCVMCGNSAMRELGICVMCGSSEMFNLLWSGYSLCDRCV